MFFLQWTLKKNNHTNYIYAWLLQNHTLYNNNSKAIWRSCRVGGDTSIPPSIRRSDLSDLQNAVQWLSCRGGQNSVHFNPLNVKRSLALRLTSKPHGLSSPGLYLGGWNTQDGGHCKNTHNNDVNSFKFVGANFVGFEILLRFKRM